jgi:cytochrome P450
VTLDDTQIEDTFDPREPFLPERAEADIASFHELQSKCPVHRQADGAWLTTTQAGVRGVLEHLESFGGTFGNYENEDPDDVILPGLAEPLHSTIRRGVNASVAYHRSVTVQPFLRTLVTRLVAEASAACARDGSVDLYQAVLLPVPASVIAHLLGVPDEDRPLFTKWGDELCERQLDGDNFDRPVGDLHPEFADYIDSHIQRRKAEGAVGDDSISRMIRAGDQRGHVMSDRMIRTQLINLLVAGNETTRNLLGSIFFRLASDPSFYAELQNDRELIAPMVEEVLRLESPVRFLVRRCSNATALEGETIEPQDTLLLSLEAANRDPTTFERPDTFDISRDNPRDHLAFGAGPHICPGAFLARLEANVVVDTYLDLVAETTLVPGTEYKANPIYWARGPVTLPVSMRLSQV